VFDRSDASIAVPRARRAVSRRRLRDIRAQQAADDGAVYARRHRDAERTQQVREAPR